MLGVYTPSLIHLQTYISIYELNPFVISDLEPGTYPSAESFYQSSKGKVSCLACGYKAYKSDMIKHVQRKHMNKLKFPCILCDKESTSEVDRKRHYWSKHDLKLSIPEIAKLKKFQDL